MGHVIISRTDRTLFRRCRRAWKWGSPLHASLIPKEQNRNLWLGIGFHFALEDYEGRKAYPTPEDAMDAFAEATRRTFGEDNLPADWRELRDQAKGMLHYYRTEWLDNRDPLVTLKIDGKPAVEVPFEVKIPVSSYLRKKIGADKVIYRGVIDRVAKDQWGNVWIVDYKTVSQHRETVLDLDTQITSYLYAVAKTFKTPVAGFCYQTHLKTVPEEPRRLQNGKLSTDKRQNTTFHRYRRAILQDYGSVDMAPEAVTNCLTDLLSRETEQGNRFVRRNFVTRSDGALDREAKYMQLEAAEMLNPKTPIYPNPAMHCDLCDFKDPCIAAEFDEDFESLLRMNYMRQVYEDRHRWMAHLPAKVTSDNAVETFA